MARRDRANPGDTDLHGWPLLLAGVLAAAVIVLGLVVGYGNRGIELPPPARVAPPPWLPAAGATTAAPSHDEEEEHAPTF
ncbi:MAG: hypothetical protein HXY24_05655 [Rubrivivax sp.]|nr:hypothetical protein [Rubrivivax sp.]